MPLPLHIQSCGNSLENRLSSPTTIIVRRVQKKTQKTQKTQNKTKQNKRTKITPQVKK